jgi:hypothetical protein
MKIETLARVSPLLVMLCGAACEIRDRPAAHVDEAAVRLNDRPDLRSDLANFEQQLAQLETYLRPAALDPRNADAGKTTGAVRPEEAEARLKALESRWPSLQQDTQRRLEALRDSLRGIRKHS